MSKKKVSASILAAAVLAVGMLGGTTTAASAIETTAGGGVWKYGNNWGTNYSEYFHSSSRHTATVQCPNQKPSRDVAAPGKWAKAQLWAVSGCNFYWSTL